MDGRKRRILNSDSEEEVGFKSMKPKTANRLGKSNDSLSSNSECESPIFKNRKKRKRRQSGSTSDESPTPHSKKGSKNQGNTQNSARDECTGSSGVQQTITAKTNSQSKVTLINGKNKSPLSSVKGKSLSSSRVITSDMDTSGSEDVRCVRKKNNRSIGSDSDSDFNEGTVLKKTVKNKKRITRKQSALNEESNASDECEITRPKTHSKRINRVSSDSESSVCGINSILRKSKRYKKKSNSRGKRRNRSSSDGGSRESEEEISEISTETESEDLLSSEDNESRARGSNSISSNNPVMTQPNPTSSSKNSESPKKAPLSDSSDSGDETCEKCSICLRSITKQEVGSPEGCDHMFCSVCLIEWSKNSNVCPLDRQQFSLILVRRNKTGNVVRQLPVEEPRPVHNFDLDDDPTFCEVCGAGDREDRMLLCDFCDRGFHTECLTPPLEEVPTETQWFCPNCVRAGYGQNNGLENEMNRFLDQMDGIDLAFLRPRGPNVQIRTRLLERIRITVNRIVRDYVDNEDDTEDEAEESEGEDDDDEDDEDFFNELERLDGLDGFSEFDSVMESPPSSVRLDSVASESQPGTSGTSRSQTRKPRVKRATRTRKVVKRKTTKTKTTRKTAGKKTKTVKRKTKKTTRRRTTKYTRKTKSKSGSRKTGKTGTRRSTRGKKKTKTTTKSARFQRSFGPPKTVKGRLALSLGMVAPKKPGQLLPDVKIRQRESVTSGMDISRAKAGIPTLHIFGPRDELQYFSSGSDYENYEGNDSGGVATVTQPRVSLSSRHRDRKKAVLALKSAPSSRSRPVVDAPPREDYDILGSILDSQAIWHSKNTDVKINRDGSVEVNKNKQPNSDALPESSKSIDVRGATSEGITTQAPMYPGSGSGSGGSFRPYRSSFSSPRGSGQDNNSFGGRGFSNQGGFNRFGGPPRNDREGYANYLNNMPQGPAGPTPFARGGPPLRFRMQSRPQLRRLPFSPRSRPPWQQEEDEEGEGEGEEAEGSEEKEGDNNQEGQSEGEVSTAVKKSEEEEEVDLYSDIEPSGEKGDSSGPEDSPTNYPALGPPPEPSAFLLGIDENGEVPPSENKNKSDVYDPAEPCDSGDEMVIDETETESPPAEKASENDQHPLVSNYSSPSESPLPTQLKSPRAASSHRASTEDDDEDCPIFSIYSSTSREFSQKEEAEREREIAEEKRKIEELKLRDDRNEETEAKGDSRKDGKDVNLDSIELPSDSEEATAKKKPNEKVGSRLSFDFEEKDEDDEDETNNKDSCADAGNEDQADEDKDKDKGSLSQDGYNSASPTVSLGKDRSRSRSKSSLGDRSPSPEYDAEPAKKSSPGRHSDRSPSTGSRKSSNRAFSRDRSSSPDEAENKLQKGRRTSKSGDETDLSDELERHLQNDDDDDYNDQASKKKDNADNNDKGGESGSESAAPKIATGLEGLDVEEVSSDNNDESDFADKKSLSSLSLSDLSHKSDRSESPIATKKKRRKRRKRKNLRSKLGESYEEGELDDSEKDKRRSDVEKGKKDNEDNENENGAQGGKDKKRRSRSAGSDRQILGSKENKKDRDKTKDRDKDLSWKKPSKKDRNYREGKRRSRERLRSRSRDKRDSRSRSRSPSFRKDRRKNRDRRKKSEKKKDIERYDVRKIVKNKDVRKTDAFGRDIISKSRSLSRSRSRSAGRDRSRNMLRRNSRTVSRSRSRSFRRGRSPFRRRYGRSHSRSKSLRRSFSRSRSRSNRKNRKKVKSKERLKNRSHSRLRKSRSLSPRRRRSLSRSRSRSPAGRLVRSKKVSRARRSWSHHISRSPSFSPRRSRSITKSPIRVRRSYSRSISRSWSRGRSPIPRASSLEKLTVVLTTKDKKKGKKKKEGKKSKREEERRKKSGNSKEVFASGDNVLVSVNFRNNNNSNDNRNSRLGSVSPVPAIENPRKKKRGSDFENERTSKKKKSSTISKNVVDVALSNACPKRSKKLTRLSEKDAEVILNRKPVAVIDLDVSPYREQTPSPVNVVVVSDSGSGDEGKEQTPQNARGSPNSEMEKGQENAQNAAGNVFAAGSPVTNGYLLTSSGPKTPPEPQIKFSINKPQQLRQIVNPLGDDDDDEDEVEEDEEEPARMESLDRRIEKELDSVSHKGPNTPPEPRGPTTPKTPPSPQTSPDAYDPFEPTKSRSPSPSQDKENRLSPKTDQKDDQSAGGNACEVIPVLAGSAAAEADKIEDVEGQDDKTAGEAGEKGDAVAAADGTTNVSLSVSTNSSVPEITINESPERKITVVITTPQSKSQTQPIQKPFLPALKQIPMAPATSSATATCGNLTVTSGVFSLPSPTKTSRTNTSTTQSLQVTGIQRLQHRLGSPVNRTPNSIKATPEKRATPRNETNEIFSSGNYLIRNVSNKRNGEQQPPQKQPRPLQDATNETIDMTIDMDDSPYSPASSEGDDMFDNPVEVSKPSQSKTAPVFKPPQKAQHKSPIKQLSKFDLLFGPTGPTLSPLKVGNKKKAKPAALPKAGAAAAKTPKKNTNKRGISLKMDEDQLRILDELPSSAVELQVKDKFLKKLNRQERVVDEVKTVLKPHYARKHITKEEYKDILRRSVPKICHSRSGEINPSKIQSLIEAYVRKFRHAKKKGATAAANPAQKTKPKKTMFS